MPELNPENEKIYCVYDPKILERARKYHTRRGLSNVQNVLRLALSYFLDKEGV